jgi:hypothetical protein
MLSPRSRTRSGLSIVEIVFLLFLFAVFIAVLIPLIWRGMRVAHDAS